MGHIISHKGVATDPEKIRCMESWPTPKTVRQLRGFLGMTGYYRKFIQRHGLISKPHTDLLKKDSIHWTEEADKSFKALKTVMTQAPVLALHDFSKPFILETDASGTGVGAVLMQNKKPIAFMSKALCPRNQALSVYERDFLAVIMAVEKWKSYLQGH